MAWAETPFLESSSFRASFTIAIVDGCGATFRPVALVLELLEASEARFKQVKEKHRNHSLRIQILIGTYNNQLRTWKISQNCLPTCFCFSDFILRIFWDCSSWLRRSFFWRHFKNKCEVNKLKSNLSLSKCVQLVCVSVLLTESTLCCCLSPVHH